MTERPKQQRKAHEQRRLSAALRENLKRRKAQAKRRQEGRHNDGGSPTAQLGRNSHDSAGIPDDKRS
jgi:hypothetical protein